MDKFKIGETVSGSHIVPFPGDNHHAGIVFSEEKEFVVQGFKNIPWQTGSNGYYLLDIHDNRYPAKLCNNTNIYVQAEARSRTGDDQLKMIFGDN